jgi:quercetin dioxygenase-like cupin family protein
LATYFDSISRTWKEIGTGVYISELHRYPTGGGAAIFKLEPGAIVPEHNHPTGEHGYVIEGTGMFGSNRLEAGDAFWIDVNETHEIRAESRLMFFATSLPRTIL